MNDTCIVSDTGTAGREALAGVPLSTETAHRLFNPNDHLTFKQRLGRCYELAGAVVLHNGDTSLVHGSIQGLNHPRLDHAWVQLADGTVWEPATSKIWQRPAFDGFFNPLVRRRYENRAALMKMQHHKHWGPWPSTA